MIIGPSAGRFYLKGASDNTLIGNVGDSVKANVTASALPSGASTAARQDILSTRTGDLAEVAPVSDTASSGLNGRLQRIAQRITSLIASITDGSQQSRLRGGTTGSIIGNTSDAIKSCLQGGDGLHRAAVDSLGRLRVRNTIYTQPIQAAITISNTSSTIAKVGANNMTNRSTLIIRNQSNKLIYYGFISGITPTNSLVIPPESTVTLNFSEFVNVYLLGENAGMTAVVVEA